MIDFFTSTKFPIRAFLLTSVPGLRRAKGPILAPSSIVLLVMTEKALITTSLPILESVIFEFGSRIHLSPMIVSPSR